MCAAAIAKADRVAGCRLLADGIDRRILLAVTGRRNRARVQVAAGKRPLQRVAQRVVQAVGVRRLRADLVDIRPVGLCPCQLLDAFRTLGLAGLQHRVRSAAAREVPFRLRRQDELASRFSPHLGAE